MFTKRGVAPADDAGSHAFSPQKFTWILCSQQIKRQALVGQDSCKFSALYHQTGPNFYYEERTLYLLLGGVLGEAQVKHLHSVHNLVIEAEDQLHKSPCAVAQSAKTVLIADPNAR